MSEADKPKALTALIVHGGWDGHEPGPLSVLFKSMLEEEGYQVELSEDLKSLSDLDKLLSLDLIVPIWTMGSIEGEYVTNVQKAVESGVGLAGCHGGMCDAFRENTEWQFLTGGQWVAHPGGDGVEYTVDVKRGASPLTEGIADFKVKSEQYYLHIDPAVDVLATTRFAVTDEPHAASGAVDMPVVWTRRWGAGRVYYNSLGHHADIFDIPEARELMRRGFLWATK